MERRPPVQPHRLPERPGRHTVQSVGVPAALAVAAALLLAATLPAGAQPAAAAAGMATPATSFGTTVQSPSDANREAIAVYSEARADCRREARPSRRDCLAQARRDHDESLRSLKAARGPAAGTVNDTAAANAAAR